MELHQLRYFCAAAETGSFTLGARRESIAQPTLSQQIGKLEKELGAQLFDRQQHKIMLTESGQIFLRSAKAILQQVQESAQLVRETATQTKRTVTVGVTPTLATYLLSPVITKLKQRNPTIKIRVVEDLPWHLLPALSNGLIDMAIVAGPGKEFRSGPIMMQSLVAVLPKGHPLAKQKKVKLIDLRNETFLLMNQRFPFREQVLQMLRGAGFEPEVAFEGSSIANIRAMVAAGAGVSLVPEMVAATKKDGCEFVRLADAHAGFQLRWATQKNRVLTRDERLLIRTIKEVAARVRLG